MVRAPVLFGNAGSSLWPVFSRSPEFSDGLPHPLDRWSERIGNVLATEWGGVALFPFGGPPWLPFLRWAQTAEAIQPSTLGMLMHPAFGLWHAYRFAMALPFHVPKRENPLAKEPGDAGARHVNSGKNGFRSKAHACVECRDTPCLSACPVDAFDGEHYALSRCVSYLDKHPESTCRQQGCLARAACPEGARFRYDPDHAAFHLQQFHIAHAQTSASTKG